MEQGPGGDAAGSNLKKRAAARQISKDDDLDAEEDEGQEGGGSGTFQRAPESVLATRRIVKVRRTPGAAASAVSAGGGGAAAANPFAGISLVAPAVVAAQGTAAVSVSVAATTSAAVEALGSAAVEERAVATSGGEEAGAAVGTSGKEEETAESGAAQPDAGTGEVEESVGLENGEAGEVEKVAENGSNGNAGGEGGEQKEVAGGGAAPQSFQQASLSANAFGSFAGSLGTGFSSSVFAGNNSSSSFAFGSAGLGATGFGAGSTGTGAFPSLSTVFGRSNGGPPFPLFGGSNNASSAAGGSSTAWRPVALQEVAVETGEEKETSVFSSDASLFEFSKEGGWKERGKGELKVNISQDSARTARLVMRSKGNYRLLLNANLFPDMKLTRMESRGGVSFACVNSAAEGKDGLVTYAVKMRDSGSVGDFMAAVDSYKGRVQPSTDLKTPENSPKASDEHPKPFEEAAPSADSEKTGAEA